MSCWIKTTSKAFKLQAGETLLDGLLRTKHMVEFQCRSGYCGSCRMHLQQGEVYYPNQPLAYIAKGDILPCCVIPKTDIELDVEVYAPVKMTG